VPSGINYEKLKGTWILHDENGYASIEIRDTNQVLVNYYLEKSKDKATQSRDYFYYQSIGNMGFWSKNSFWISTDKYRMDFDWLGDKLKEIVKDGEGDMYYRVYTEEEIAYQFMDSSTLDGRVRNVFPNKEKGYYEIIMN